MDLIRRIVILAVVSLLCSTAAAQFPGWSHRLWLGDTTATINEAVQQITEADQREWLGYLASRELDGRKPNTAGYQKAAAYVESKCQSWGLQTERQTVPSRDQNMFAYITGASIPDEVVVVGAHLDHLGNGNLGADDNGSGSTALMSIAHAFSVMEPGPRTIVFQWYTAEESGLIGSGYYVNNPTFPKGSPSIRKHVAMINLDMVGRFRIGYQYDAAVVAESLEMTISFRDYVSRLKTKYPFGSELTLTSGNRSDHARFASAGIPAVWCFTGTHQDYHSPRDTVDKINFDGMVKVAQYVAELAYLCVHEGQAVMPDPFSIDEKALVNENGESFRTESSTRR